MYCMNCVAELPKDATFCSRCGEMCLKPLARTPAPKRNAAAAPIYAKDAPRLPQKWEGGGLFYSICC